MGLQLREQMEPNQHIPSNFSLDEIIQVYPNTKISDIPTRVLSTDHQELQHLYAQIRYANQLVNGIMESIQTNTSITSLKTALLTTISNTMFDFEIIKDDL